MCESDGWLPIESAPMNENFVAGYYGEQRQFYGMTGTGHLFQWEGMPRPCFTGFGAVRPTHWMPLPEAPADKGEG